MLLMSDWYFVVILSRVSLKNLSLHNVDSVNCIVDLGMGVSLGGGGGRKRELYVRISHLKSSTQGSCYSYWNSQQKHWVYLKRSCRHPFGTWWWLVIHGIDELEILDRVTCSWLYSLETYMGFLKRSVRNSARLESSMATRYLLDETLGFLTCHLKDFLHSCKQVWGNDEELGMPNMCLKVMYTGKIWQTLKLVRRKILSLQILRAPLRYWRLIPCVLYL